MALKALFNSDIWATDNPFSPALENVVNTVIFDFGSFSFSFFNSSFFCDLGFIKNKKRLLGVYRALAGKTLCRRNTKPELAMHLGVHHAVYGCVLRSFSEGGYSDISKS